MWVEIFELSNDELIISIHLILAYSNWYNLSKIHLMQLIRFNDVGGHLRSKLNYISIALSRLWICNILYAKFICINRQTYTHTHIECEAKIHTMHVAAGKWFHIHFAEVDEKLVHAFKFTTQSTFTRTHTYSQKQKVRQTNYTASVSQRQRLKIGITHWVHSFARFFSSSSSSSPPPTSSSFTFHSLLFISSTTSSFLLHLRDIPSDASFYNDKIIKKNNNNKPLTQNLSVSFSFILFNSFHFLVSVRVRWIVWCVFLRLPLCYTQITFPLCIS